MLDYQVRWTSFFPACLLLFSAFGVLFFYFSLFFFFLCFFFLFFGFEPKRMEGEVMGWGFRIWDVGEVGLWLRWIRAAI